jgi:hypothetical protein
MRFEMLRYWSLYIRSRLAVLAHRDVPPRASRPSKFQLHISDSRL